MGKSKHILILMLLKKFTHISRDVLTCLYGTAGCLLFNKGQCNLKGPGPPLLKLRKTILKIKDRQYQYNVEEPNRIREVTGPCFFSLLSNGSWTNVGK